MRFEREWERKKEQNESGRARGGSGSGTSKREAEAWGKNVGKWEVTVAALPLSVRGRRGWLLKEGDDRRAPPVIEPGRRECCSCCRAADWAGLGMREREGSAWAGRSWARQARKERGDRTCLFIFQTNSQTHFQTKFECYNMYASTYF